MRRYFLEMLIGFVVATVLALGPPIAFLAMPGAGFFLFVVPIWSVGVVCVLFVGLLIFGRIPSAIGVGLLVVAVALSPVGSAVIALAKEIDRNLEKGAKSQANIERKRQECMTADFAPLKQPSAKYDLLVLEKMDMCGAHDYDVPDTVALLTGMRVVQAGRVCFDNRHADVREIVAEPSNSCAGGRDSANVGITPRLVPKKVAPLHVDVCLRRRDLSAPPDDRTPAIVLRDVPFGYGGCLVTEVIERTASGDVSLGRVRYSTFNQRYYPDLAVPEGVPRNNWLIVLLSAVLQQDLSDKALMARAVATAN